MSDISVLSQEYKTSSEFAESVNQALIMLKKVCLGLPGHEAISQEEREGSRYLLAAVAAAVAAALEPGMGHSAGEGIAVPRSLLARLRAERRGDLNYYLEELKDCAVHLAAGLVAVTEGDFTVLDQLSAAADAETSTVFRRLMRQ